MISIVIPTLNEVQNVPKVLRRISEVNELVPFEREIIFVDDNSNDGTQAAIEKFALQDSSIHLVHSPQRCGLGGALKLGIENAKGSLILFLDCDVSVSTKDLSRLIAARGDQKMVIGSRYLPQCSIYGVSKSKVFLSRLLNRILHLALGISAIDISHSLRIFPKPHYPLPKNNTHPAFFWELSLLGQRYLENVCEVPVDFVERDSGVTKNTTVRMVKSTLKGIVSVFMIKWRFK